MSAILERTGIVLPERLPVSEPATGPGARSQSRTRTQHRVSPLAAVGFSIRLALASVVFVCVSSGVCQYLFEQARHMGNAATARAQVAENSLAGLRSDVDRLQSADRMQTWAALNGFASSYLASNEKPK